MGSSLSRSHLPRNYWAEETGQVKNLREIFDAAAWSTPKLGKTLGR